MSLLCQPLLFLFTECFFTALKQGVGGGLFVGSANLGVAVVQGDAREKAEALSDTWRSDLPWQSTTPLPRVGKIQSENIRIEFDGNEARSEMVSYLDKCLAAQYHFVTVIAQQSYDRRSVPRRKRFFHGHMKKVSTGNGGYQFQIFRFKPSVSSVKVSSALAVQTLQMEPLVQPAGEGAGIGPSDFEFNEDSLVRDSITYAVHQSGSFVLSSVSKGSLYVSVVRFLAKICFMLKIFNSLFGTP